MKIWVVFSKRMRQITAEGAFDTKEEAEEFMNFELGVWKDKKEQGCITERS